VRGAVEPLPGVEGITIEPQNKEIAVDYNTAAVTEEQILEALSKANWPAKPKQ